MLCQDAVHDKDRVQYSICREDGDDMCFMNVKVILPSSHVHSDINVYCVHLVCTYAFST